MMKTLTPLSNSSSKPFLAEISITNTDHGYSISFQWKLQTPLGSPDFTNYRV